MGRRLTRDEAIALFQEVHGHRYDYTDTKYNGALSPIDVLCPEHGPFTVIANNHRIGFGCRYCKKEHRQKAIFEEFSKIHNRKYDYSGSVYIAENRKIRILCPEHGYFERLAMTHRKGLGCNKCAEKIVDTESLISAFRKVHGDQYDYSKTIFVCSTEKVLIGCSEHGYFAQNIYRHLDYQGCPRCAGTFKKNTDEIIAEFKLIHGQRYDYSLVEYDGNNRRVKIKCQKHGVFEQTPKAHKKSSGCPQCRINIKKVADEIPSFEAVHGQKYDYSLAKGMTYRSSHERIPVKCSKHGVFKQSIASHRKGSGCPMCAQNRRRQSN